MKTPTHQPASRVLTGIRRSRWRIVVQGFALAGMIMQPVSVSFGDWVTGGTNGNLDYSWDDTDSNGVWDSGEEGFLINSDTDLLPDQTERTIGTDIYNPDTDYDGLNDYDEAVALVPSGFSFSPLAADTDGDGFSDQDEFYGCYSVNYAQYPPSLSGWTYSDWDGDGVKNHADAYPFDPSNGAFNDSDGDGSYDSFDTHPTDPLLWDDHNGNGVNDSVEPNFTDTDSDGHEDASDSHPSNINLWCDWNGNGTNDDQHTDFDGVPDDYDSHPLDSVLWSDWNGNGTNDDADTDADGVPDEIDSHPANAALWSDWNGNGTNDDQDGDADGVPDESDSHPSNAGLWCDWNGNGTNDTSEVDADNDTVWDSLDSHPNNSGLWSDWNGSGINDDQNSDGDTAVDDYDSDPLVPSLWSDWNRNGVNDDQNSDTDTVADDYDSDPLNSSLWADWNRNGVNDFDEPPPPQDSDADGVFNSNDSDPYNWWLWDDWNRNGVNDSQEWIPPDDSDDDGIPDNLDEYPNDPFNGDSDQDGALDAIEAQHGAVIGALDTDEDGLTDGQEINTTGTDPADVDTDGDLLTDSEETMISALVHLGLSPLNDHSLSAQFNDWEMARPRLLDTDDDEIPNYVEVLYGLNPNDPTDATGDLDADGTLNLAQYQQGRSLLAGIEVFDHDDDGMSDVWEEANGLNPNWFDDALADPDWDQVKNYEEYLSGAYYLSWVGGSESWVQWGQMDPHDATTFEEPEYVQFRPEDYVDSWWGYRVMSDWDRFYNLTLSYKRVWGIKIMSVPDQMPLMYPYYLNRSGSDIDGDQMPDIWEYRYHLDCRVCMDGPWDLDSDGLSNMLEYRLRTDPTLQDSFHDGVLDGNRDSDGDGLTNIYEVTHYDLDPANPADAGADPDGDGLTTLQEIQMGLDPLLNDSDGDGFRDGFEVSVGSNPASASSTPVTIALQKLAQLEALKDTVASLDGLSDAVLDQWFHLLRDLRELQDLLLQIGYEAYVPDLADIQTRVGVVASALTARNAAIAPMAMSEWRISTPGAGNSPEANNDADFWDDLMEYVLGSDPASGVPVLLADPVRRSGLRLRVEDQSVTAYILRPATTIGVTCQLEFSSDLINWGAFGAPDVFAPVIGVNTLAWSNIDGGGSEGFVRLAVTDGSGVISRTHPMGWSKTTFTGQQTFGPTLSRDILYTGTVKTFTDTSLTVQDDETRDLRTLFTSGKASYVEFTEGPGEGERIDIVPSQCTERTIALDLASPNNTTAEFPAGMSQARFVIRNHLTLGEAFPKNAFYGINSANKSDQISRWENGAWASPASYWLLNTNTAHYWVHQSGANITDESGAVIRPDEAFLVSRREHDAHGGSLPPSIIVETGEVRGWRMRRVLKPGAELNAVAGAYPLGQSPNDLGMTVEAGFKADNDPSKASRLYRWAGDQTPGQSAYESLFLMSGTVSKPGPRWVTTNNATLDDLSVMPFALRSRASIVISRYSVDSPESVASETQGFSAATAPSTLLTYLIPTPGSLSANPTNPYREDVGGDGDGLPDAWEWWMIGLNGSDSYNGTADVKPEDDPDGDLLTNLEELHNGTDPLNSADGVRVVVVTATQAGSASFNAYRSPNDYGGATRYFSTIKIERNYQFQETVDKLWLEIHESLGHQDTYDHQADVKQGAYGQVVSKVLYPILTRNLIASHGGLGDWVSALESPPVMSGNISASGYSILQNTTHGWTLENDMLTPMSASLSSIAPAIATGIFTDHVTIPPTATPASATLYVEAESWPGGSSQNGALPYLTVQYAFSNVGFSLPREGTPSTVLTNTVSATGTVIGTTFTQGMASMTDFTTTTLSGEITLDALNKALTWDTSASSWANESTAEWPANGAAPSTYEKHPSSLVLARARYQFRLESKDGKHKALDSMKKVQWAEQYVPDDIEGNPDPSQSRVLAFYSAELGFNGSTPERVLDAHAVNESASGTAYINPFLIDITEVISDQIAGNEANKLPTAFYGGQPNNPMLMATRSGADARLAIKVNVPADHAASIRVGVRQSAASAKVPDSGVNPVLASVPAVASPGKTNLSFTALEGSKAYEVVAGYDANGNSILDSTEAVVVFQKTPKTEKNGNPYSPLPGKGDPTYKWLDKIIVVTQGDFTTARTTTDGYGGLPWSMFYPTGAKLIQAFARGASTISGASPTEYGVTLDASVIPSIEGLAHPLGGTWDVANQTTTHRIVLPIGSDLSDDVESSNGLRKMFGRVLWKNRAILTAAATNTWETKTLIFEDKDFDFATSDRLDQVHAALGKCKFAGSLDISLRSTAEGGFEVDSLNCQGSILDLFDFAYGSDAVGFGPVTVEPIIAARTQAGYASLTSPPWSDAGRVFYTKVEIATGWFEYIGTYPP